MAHIRIEMDRGNGWEVRSEAPGYVTMAEVRANLPAYALQYPHRVLINCGPTLLIAVPKGRTLTRQQIHDCHEYAGANGAAIEFLS